MRQVVQIAVSVSMAADCGISDDIESLVALCEDGTMWDMVRSYDKATQKYTGKWQQLPNVPQE